MNRDRKGNQFGRNAQPSRGRARATLVQIRSDWMLACGVIIGLSMLLLAIAPGLVSNQNPRSTDAFLALTGPSVAHWFGTDALGRDVLSRVVYGARTSLGVAGVSVLFAALAGSLLGLSSGYFGGLLDQVLGRLMDIVFSLPALMLAIVIAGILGPSLRNAIIAIGIVYVPHFYRIARSGAIAVAARPFILSCHLIGASHGRILFRHILPNISAPLAVQFTVTLAYAILLEASLSFLGLGVQPPNPSWGSILNEGRPFMLISPWLSMFPGIMILLSVLAMNFISDSLRDSWDTSMSKR